MRAIECHSTDGPRALVFTEIETPLPGPGEVRIRVAAAGVNFADSLMSLGKYQERPALPFVPGLELAGQVDALGPGVDHLAVGQRVLALVDKGAFAEFALARASDVFGIPDSMGMAEAAGFPITYGTAVAALDWRAGLRPNERLLVHGAGGGVGAAAVACGRAMGAQVTATARGETKLDIALRQGAQHAIDSERPDLVDELKRLVPERFDVVFDPVGGVAFQASMKCMAWEGRIVVIGFASGDVPQIPANHLLVKNIAVTGLYWGSYRKHAPERLRTGFDKLFDWYARSKLGDIQPTVVGFDQGIQAIDDIANRRTVGKVVIEVSL